MPLTPETSGIWLAVLSRADDGADCLARRGSKLAREVKERAGTLCSCATRMVSQCGPAEGPDCCDRALQIQAHLGNDPKHFSREGGIYELGARSPAAQSPAGDRNNLRCVVIAPSAAEKERGTQAGQSGRVCLHG